MDPISDGWQHLDYIVLGPMIRDMPILLLSGHLEEVIQRASASCLCTAQEVDLPG